MLSALIRRDNSEISDKRRGDVICVKLSEFAAWGKVESVVHHVTEWEDFDLEESMRQELESTGISPVRTSWTSPNIGCCSSSIRPTRWSMTMLRA